MRIYYSCASGTSQQKKIIFTLTFNLFRPQRRKLLVESLKCFFLIILDLSRIFLKNVTILDWYYIKKQNVTILDYPKIEFFLMEI